MPVRCPCCGAEFALVPVVPTPRRHVTQDYPYPPPWEPVGYVGPALMMGAPAGVPTTESAFAGKGCCGEPDIGGEGG